MSDRIDLYEILEVSRSGSKEDIKKAYRKQALKSHPDKAPVDERPAAEIKFKAVQEAYDILYDDDKRHLYDTHGMSAFDGSRPGPGGMGAEMDMEDIINMFGMGGGMPGAGGMGGMGGFEFDLGGGAGGRKKKGGKGESVRQEYTVSLEDLYKGKTTKFTNSKKVLCPTCEGRGGKAKAQPHSCGVCGGKGFNQRMMQQGPFVTPVRSECTTCFATGRSYETKDRCKKCKGSQVVESKGIIELYVPPGSAAGDKIISANEADQLPGQSEPGNIIWTLIEAPHEVFERDGHNLKADLHITLAEALTGFDRIVLKHLDGRGIQMRIAQPNGKILKPGQLLRVPGEGMPIKRSEAKGDLFLEVVIDFPEDGWLKDEKAIKQLQEILPKPKQPITADIVDEVDFKVMSAEEMEEQSASWEDEDDEDEDAPGAAQCAQQ